MRKVMNNVKTRFKWAALGASTLILTAVGVQAAPRRAAQTASRDPGNRTIVMRITPSGANAFTSVDFWNSRLGLALSTDSIYLTRNGGKTFSREYTSANAQLYGIQTLSSEEIWAFGYNSILHTANGGIRWQTLAAPPGPGAISDVAFGSPMVGYAVKGDITSGPTHVWKTINGGRTWHASTTPAGTSELAWCDPLDGFLLTGAGELYGTTNGGQTWRMTAKLPKEQGEYPAAGRLIADGPRDAWLLLFGGAGMSQGSYAVFHTTNGINWRPVLGVSTAGAGPAPGGASNAPAGPGSSPGGLAVVNSRIAYMSGGCEACGFGTVQVDGTANGGRSWSHGSVIFGAGASVYGYWSLSFPNQKDGWLATQAGLLHTTDGGGKWREVYPLSAVTPVTASFVTPTLGYGVGIVGDANTVVRTTDGGHDWAPVGKLPGHPANSNDWNTGTSVSFSSADHGIATLYGHVYRTVDGGRHWQLIQLPDKTGYGYASVQFLSAQLGVIGQPSYGDQQPIWVTTNAGRTWHSVSGNLSTVKETLLGRTLRQQLAALTGNGQATLDGTWSGRLAWLTTSRGEIEVTTDGGRKWTTLTFPATFQPQVSEMQFLTPLVGWLQTQSGGWYRTTDGGRAWTWLG